MSLRLRYVIGRNLAGEAVELGGGLGTSRDGLISFGSKYSFSSVFEDDGELFDFQYATRSHVKRTFANNYDIAILLKGIKERENIIIIEGHYLNTLDSYVANMSCKDQKLLELVYLDYKQRVDWTRAFLNMCQTKRLQLDIVNVNTLKNALDIVQRNSVKQKHVIAISTISQYYTMPLTECVISQDTGIIGIHVPLLKDTLKNLTMKRVITPTFAWEEFTCSVNIPSFAVALVERNERWSIVVPKCDPFREDLCLVTEAYNAETLVLLCIRQVLVGGSTRQFASVCPVSCRETGRQNQFISFVGSHRAWITHPKPGLSISCQGERHQLNIEPGIGALLVEVPCYCHFEDNDGIDVYPTYPCVDKTIKFHIQKVLPAVWTKTPGLTLPSWDKTMPQFDDLNDCLNERWINANSDSQSTPIITYFVIANSIIIILSTLTYIYLHCKTQCKFLVDPNRKMNPSDKKPFRFRSLKLSGPTMTFKRHCCGKRREYELP
ncbi:hypothetical protein FQA39_LY08284 [Lamprigera yunnana]|nr:hypothetical protein FQA39_LY08284 [Lamprigera yunnana]